MPRSTEQIIQEIELENSDTVTDPRLLKKLYTELDGFSHEASVKEFLADETYHDQYVRLMGKNPRQS